MLHTLLTTFRTSRSVINQILLYFKEQHWWLREFGIYKVYFWQRRHHN